MNWNWFGNILVGTKRESRLNAVDLKIKSVELIERLHWSFFSSQEAFIRCVSQRIVSQSKKKIFLMTKSFANRFYRNESFWSPGGPAKQRWKKSKLKCDRAEVRIWQWRVWQNLYNSRGKGSRRIRAYRPSSVLKNSFIMSGSQPNLLNTSGPNMENGWSLVA